MGHEPSLADAMCLPSMSTYCPSQAQEASGMSSSGYMLMAQILNIEKKHCFHRNISIITARWASISSYPRPSTKIWCRPGSHTCPVLVTSSSAKD